MDLSEARIYVGTYAKYNNGSLQGEWVELSDFYDLDDFMERCAEIHEDEEEPEYMFPALSLIHISEPTRREWLSRMPSSA